MPRSKEQKEAFEKNKTKRWNPPDRDNEAGGSSSNAILVPTGLNVSTSTSDLSATATSPTMASTPNLSSLILSSSQEPEDKEQSFVSQETVSSSTFDRSAVTSELMDTSDIVSTDNQAIASSSTLSKSSNTAVRKLSISNPIRYVKRSLIDSDLPILPNVHDDFENPSNLTEATPKKRKICQLEALLINETGLKNDFQKQLQESNLKHAFTVSELARERRENLQQSHEIRDKVLENETLKTQISELKNKYEEVIEKCKQYDETYKTAVTESSRRAATTDAVYMEVREDLLNDGSVLTLRPKGAPGQGSYYVKAPSVQVVQSSLTKARFGALKWLLTAISCPNNTFQPQLVATCVKQFLDKEPQINMLVAKDQSMPKLTANDTLDVKICLGLSWRKFRMLKSFLIERNLDVFNSEHEIWKVLRQRQLKSEINFEYIEIHDMDGNIVKRPCVLVKDLNGFVAECCQRHIEKGDFEDTPGCEGKFRLVISGDKGGDTTKLTISFSNVKKSNSVRNLHIIGYYEGPDSAAALRAVFQRFAEDFKKLKNITLPYPKGDGTFEQREVCVFLVGDTNFICHFMGHKGSSAKYPCLFCLVPKTQLQTTGPKKKDVWNIKHRKRSFKIIENESQTDEPLFDIDEDKVCTPTVHIPLGIVTGIKNKVQALCHKIDFGKVFDDVDAKTLEETKMDKLLEQKGKEIENAKTIVDNINNDCELVLSIIDFIEEKVKRSKSLKDTRDEICEASICLMKMPFFKQKENEIFNNWFQCENCRTSEHDAWYHAPCALLFFPNEIQEANTKAAYYCLKCSHGDNRTEKILSLTKQKFKEMSEIKQHFERQLLEAQLKFDKAANDIRKNQGEATKAFIESLKKLGVDILAYHTGTIVGNHVKKILNPEIDGPKIFLECLESMPLVQKKYYDFLTLLNKIFSISNAARELDDNEIEQICILCRELGELHARDFEDETITPKLHMLIEHVPQFALTHRTVGLFSEQPIESLHAVINSIIRLFKIRGDSRRMPLMYNYNVQLAAVPTRTSFEPKPRKLSKKLTTEKD